MAGPIQDKIKRSLQAAEGLSHRLVLLVGESGSGKTTCVLHDVADDFGTEVVNINLALSSELSELAAKQRSRRRNDRRGAASRITAEGLLPPCASYPAQAQPLPFAVGREMRVQQRGHLHPLQLGQQRGEIINAFMGHR